MYQSGVLVASKAGIYWVVNSHNFVNVRSASRVRRRNILGSKSVRVVRFFESQFTLVPHLYLTMRIIFLLILLFAVTFMRWGFS